MCKVAVNDFNMGAMENKGLNVFNTALTLADPQSATDVDYERVSSLCAHCVPCNIVKLTLYAMKSRLNR